MKDFVLSVLISIYGVADVRVPELVVNLFDNPVFKVVAFITVIVMCSVSNNLIGFIVLLAILLTWDKIQKQQYTENMKNIALLNFK